MNAAGRPATVGFRRADAGRPSASGSEELREQLQRRLFVAGTLLGAAGALLGAINLVTGSALWDGRPWHPFSPFIQLGYAALVLLAVRRLGTGRRFELPTLRLSEGLIFGPLALFTCALLIADFETIRDVLPIAPRDLGMAHSAFWVLGMVAYGALVPNTARRTAATLSALALLAFVPDVWALSEGILTADVAPLFLTYKAVFVVGSWVAVSYGSYRYELATRREAKARELGQYVLGERLGAGGMGEVYLGEHRMLRRPVAIKLITPAQAGSAEAIVRFEREAQATARLTHPNTIQVFDYGRAEDGTFYCVMEYLPGRTLEEIVRADGPVAPARAARILTQLCGALGEAHAAGLVHRDIKPSNVMLTERGGIPDVAKLLDFGLVVARGPSDGRLTETGTFVGTPEFMSPEQCAGTDTAIGPASDLYALGAVGYFLVTGRSPFAGRSATQMLAAHLYEAPVAPSTLLPGLPAALDRVLLRCLAKQPADRYADAAAVAAALQAITASAAPPR